MSQQSSMEVTVRGRTFVVSFDNPAGGFVSPAEFTKVLEDGIQMGDQMGVGAINGSTSNNMFKKIKYEEITTDEAMDQYHAAQALTTFFDGIDRINSGKVKELVTNDLGRLYAEVRENLISPEQGAVQMNDAITRARQEVRRMEQREYFDAAEKWANTPNISVAEACHGVAYDNYRFANPEQPQVMVRQEYGNMYDNHYADKIKAAKIRAAKDLFGGK